FGLAEARRRHLDANLAEGLLAAGLTGGLAGSWLYGAIQHALDHWFGVQDEVGMVSYGGFLGAAALMLMYARWRRFSWWFYADAFTPGVLLMVAIGRIGCFLNWDDYGVHTSVRWAVDGGDG